MATSVTTEGQRPTWRRVAAIFLAYVISVFAGLWVALLILSLNAKTSQVSLASAVAVATTGLGYLGVWVLGLFLVPGLTSLAIRDRRRYWAWSALSAALIWGLWTAALIGIATVFSGRLSIGIPGGGLGLAGIAAASGCAFGTLISRDIRRR